MKVLLLFMTLGVMGIWVDRASASVSSSNDLAAALNQEQLATAIKELAKDAADLKARIRTLQKTIAVTSVEGEKEPVQAAF